MCGLGIAAYGKMEFDPTVLRSAGGCFIVGHGTVLTITHR
jgi:hypothetical protein